VHPARKVPWPILTVAATSLVGCTTIDPGTDYAVAPETFDADYFYCHVEPGFIFQQNCGPGIASDNGSCHFSAAVSGMNLQAHPAIDCAGGDHPALDAQGLGSTGTGSAAQSNFTSVSLEMTRDYTMAPLFLRPTAQVAHPRQIFPPTDVTVIQLLSTWASK
jgi:hypothetical protein